MQPSRIFNRHTGEREGRFHEPGSISGRISGCRHHGRPYVTAHRCADGLKKKLELGSGSQRHRHVVGCLTCPSKHSHGANHFMVIPRNRSISVAFYDAHGDTEDLFSS